MESSRRESTFGRNGNEDENFRSMLLQIIGGLGDEYFNILKFLDHYQWFVPWARNCEDETIKNLLKLALCEFCQEREVHMKYKDCKHTTCEECWNLGDTCLTCDAVETLNYANLTEADDYEFSLRVDEFNLTMNGLLAIIRAFVGSRLDPLVLFRTYPYMFEWAKCTYDDSINKLYKASLCQYCMEQRYERPQSFCGHLICNDCYQTDCPYCLHIERVSNYFGEFASLTN